MVIKMNVPKLRFTGFYGDWEKISLKKLSNEISYGMNSPSKEYDGKNAYIRITDIDENTGRFNKNNIVSPDGNLENKYLVNDNDILFARTGASTGKTYLYSKEDGKLYYAGFLIKASIKNDYDSNFIYQQTKTRKYKKWVKIMSMRSGQPGINSEEYGSYLFSITTKKEQEKISNLLKLIDKKIELQSQKIEALKLYKKGILEDQIKKLSIYNLVPLSDILIERKKYSEKGLEYPHVTLSKDGIFDKGNRYNRDFLVKSDDKNYKITKYNDICYNPANVKFGVICINKYGSAIFSPIYVTFEVNKKVNADFVNLYITRKNFINEVRKFEQGTVYERMAVAPDDFVKFKISLPPIKVQEKITTLFSKLDSHILLENKKIEKLNELKKGLMQNMFV